MNNRNQNTPDFGDLRGLGDSVRRIADAIARRERVLLVAGPGSGAVAVARRTVGLLPPMNDRERMQVNIERGRAGMSEIGEERPFRAPHHTVSYAGLLGREAKQSKYDNPGVPALPGEVGLARHGVLLLDQAPEFTRAHLGAVGSRLRKDTLLIATAQPCPCGNRLHPHKSRCVCSEGMLERWEKRVAMMTDALGITTTITLPFLSNEKRAHGERCPTTAELIQPA